MGMISAGNHSRFLRCMTNNRISSSTGFASMAAISSRNFSTPVNNSTEHQKAEGGDSIFASADYFKDVEPSEIV